MTIIDLTHTMENGMIHYHAPWHHPYEISKLATIKDQGRETRQVTFGTHTGTHMDAPSHFIEGGDSIGKIPLERLVGLVTIVDFSHMRKNEAVTSEMVQRLQVTPKMIFKFGWADNWNTDHFYNDYPYVNTDAAQYLVDHNLELLGMDTPSPDDSRLKMGSARDSETHKIFLGNNVVLVEYLDLNQVSDYNGWTLAVLPLKLKGADGSPVRACIFR